MSPYRNPFPSRPPLFRQKGAALLVLFLVLGVAAAALLVTSLTRKAAQMKAEENTVAALAQAKDALVGHAAIYRDTHPDGGGWTDKVWGYLPCPDTNNDGAADAPCGAKNVTVAGRLPWRTLGLPPPRDGAGECLWYVVSGRAKNSPLPDVVNWDTTGQIEVRNAAGQVLAAPGSHDTPWAVLIAPGAALGGQDRTPVGATQCGGNATLAAYVEGLTLNPAASADSLLVLATNDSAADGTNNDRGLWITSREIFAPIKRRGDFAGAVGTLLDDMKTSLEAAAPPLATAFTAASAAGCPVTDGPADQTKDYFRCNWANNLKFAESAGITVNGETCSAVLIFSGERTAGQSRVTAADQANPVNYLEAPLVGLFPNGGSYTGATAFNPALPSADLVRCVKAGASAATDLGQAILDALGLSSPPGDTGATSVTLADGTVVSTGGWGTITVTNQGVGVDTFGNPALTFVEALNLTFPGTRNKLALYLNKLNNNERANVIFYNGSTPLGSTQVRGCSNSGSIFNNISLAGNPNFTSVWIWPQSLGGIYVQGVKACAGTEDCSITVAGADTCPWP